MQWQSLIKIQVRTKKILHWSIHQIIWSDPLDHLMESSKSAKEDSPPDDMMKTGMQIIQCTSKSEDPKD